MFFFLSYMYFFKLKQQIYIIHIALNTYAAEKTEIHVIYYHHCSWLNVLLISLTLSNEEFKIIKHDVNNSYVLCIPYVLHWITVNVAVILVGQTYLSHHSCHSNGNICCICNSVLHWYIIMTYRVSSLSLVN
jgi:hypothetical protein